MSKAMCLSQPTYYYLHAVLSKLVNGHGDNTCVLNRQELLYLHSMVQIMPFYLGHIVAEYLRYQGQYSRIGVIFSWP